MRGRVFRGTPASAALFQPYISTEMLQTHGAPVGIRSDNVDLMWLHPFTLPSNTINILIEGMKGEGKSTFAKCMILRLSELQAKNVLGQPEDWRSRIMTRKSEEGSAEYDPILNKAKGVKHSLGHGNRINLIGLLRRLTDQINFTINVVQQIGKRWNDPKVSVAITIAVRDLHEADPTVVGEALILERLRQLTLEDFRKYYRARRASTFNMFKAEFDANPKLSSQLNFDDNSYEHVDESFLEAAQHAAGCLDALCGSDYSDAFGGKESLYDVLTSRFVMLDTEDLTDAASEMVDSVLMLAEASAIRYSKSDIGTPLDMTRIVPHHVIHDEEGAEMSGKGKQRSLMHARYMANKQAKSRAYGNSEWYLEQYDYQIAEAGDIGSEMRNLARQINDGFDIRIYFRIPNDDETKNKIAKLGMKDHFIDRLTEQDVGEATLFVRDRDPIQFRHLVFSSEAPLIKSDAARNRGGKPTPLWENSETARRLLAAARNNVDLTGSALG